MKQLAGDNVRLDGKQLNRELPKKKIDPYYLTDSNLKVGFIITLESHHNNHAHSNLIIKPNYPEFGIEFRYIKKDSSVIYATFINHYKFIIKTAFLAKFDKQDEDSQVLDETEIFMDLNINHILTETDIDNVDNISSLEDQIQQQEMKEFGWRLDK